MFIVCCKYMNINYRLYYILDIFLLFRYLIQFLEKLKGGVISQQRYSLRTSLPSPLKI